VGKYSTAGQATDGNITWRMRIAYWLTKATDTHTHTEYAILIVFPLHQRSSERAPMLRRYVHCLSCLYVSRSHQQSTVCSWRDVTCGLMMFSMRLSQRHAPAALYPLERPGTHCTEGWVGPRAGLDRCGKSRPPPEFDPRTVQPEASHYTDWAIRPTKGLLTQWGRSGSFKLFKRPLPGF